ncbi:MAG: collagenase [Chloroflexaceae bacterium]
MHSDLLGRAWPSPTRPRTVHPRLRIRRFAWLIAMAVLVAIPSSGLPLAVAPVAPPIRTPDCPASTYPDVAALLEVLPGAGYACAEELAAALRPRADVALTDALLDMAAHGAHARARRNALRVLGRFAEAPRGSRAHELVMRARASALRATLAGLLATERDASALADAIWLLDTFFYPDFGAGPALERLASDTTLDPALRHRAALARARLVHSRPGVLSGADRRFILTGLRADDPGVRAAAATAVAHLRTAQLDSGARAELGAALAAARNAEPPLSLAADDPPPVGPAVSESRPTPLTAAAAIARGQDRLAGGTAHLERLQADYETLALPYAHSGGGVRIRSGLPPARLAPLVADIEQAQEHFFSIVGSALRAPIPGEETAALTVLVFARQGIYRDYLRAFTAFGVETDGVYDENTATVYTYARTAGQSENRLEESLRHELSHHLAGRHLFPGAWHTPGYHREPKGWADEGLAEMLAGSGPAGPALRRAQLQRLCARTTPPALAGLLARREGYDRFGQFDYDAAWALSFYLFTERPEGLRRLYRAYRDGSYRLGDWPHLVGAPLATVERDWHAAITRWCVSHAPPGRT